MKNPTFKKTAAEDARRITTGGGFMGGIYPKIKKEVAMMKEKNLERLYTLLERAEREHDTETAAALRWAIFELENR